MLVQYSVQCSVEESSSGFNLPTRCVPQVSVLPPFLVWMGGDWPDNSQSPTPRGRSTKTPLALSLHLAQGTQYSTSAAQTYLKQV